MPKQRHHCVTDSSPRSSALTSFHRSPMTDVFFHGISVEIVPVYEKSVTHVLLPKCYLCPDTVPSPALSPRGGEGEKRGRQAVPNIPTIIANWYNNTRIRKKRGMEKFTGSGCSYFCPKMKNPARLNLRGWRNRTGSTLAVLEAFARPGLAVFFAFALAGIAGRQPLGLKGGDELDVR